MLSEPNWRSIKKNLNPLGPAVKVQIEKYEKVRDFTRRLLSVDPYKYCIGFVSGYSNLVLDIMHQIAASINQFGSEHCKSKQQIDIMWGDFNTVMTHHLKHSIDQFKVLTISFSRDIYHEMLVLKQNSLSKIKSTNKRVIQVIHAIIDLHTIMILENFEFHRKNVVNILDFSLTMVRAGGDFTAQHKYMLDSPFFGEANAEQFMKSVDVTRIKNLGHRKYCLNTIRYCISQGFVDVPLKNISDLLSFSNHLIRNHSISPYWLDAFVKHTATQETVENNVKHTGKSVFMREQFSTAIEYKAMADLILKSIMISENIAAAVASMEIMPNTKVRIAFVCDLAEFDVKGYVLHDGIVKETTYAKMIVQSWEENNQVHVETFNFYPVMP